MKTLPQVFMQVESHLPAVAHATVQQAGKYGVEVARTTHLFHHSVRFEEAITFEQMGIYQGEIISHAPQSQYIEFGNNQKGDKIYPVNKKALHFWSHGQEFFVKWVHAHPPIAWMSGEVHDKVQAALPGIWQQEFNRIIK